MNLREIRKLIQLMKDNDLSELNVTDGDKTIALKRAAPPGAPAPAAAALAEAPAPAVEAASPHEGLLEVRSPMVGTFYAAASPEGEAFVDAGTPVGPDSVVCIVEAMKVMNEIKAECSGTIAEVVVENGRPVEYGQVLFRVRP